MVGPEIIVPLGFFATVAVVIIGRPLVGAWSKKLDNESKRPAVAPEVMTRLERMEQSIDAIAVEVERISEGQRFTTKLLSEPNTTHALPERAASQDPRTP
jgi:hypothetical protein